MAFYMFCGHRGCLADCVDLIHSLYRCGICFGSSSLATLPLGFSCGFFPPLHVGLLLSRAGGFGGFAPVRASYGGDAAVWVIGFLAALRGVGC